MRTIFTSLPHGRPGILELADGFAVRPAAKVRKHKNIHGTPLRNTGVQAAGYRAGDVQ
jgi:hypothetical protein